MIYIYYIQCFRELPIRLDVWFFEGEPYGRMLVVDENDVFRKIMGTLQKKSFGMIVRVMICDKLVCFTG